VGTARPPGAAALYGLADPPTVAEVLVTRPRRGHRDRPGLHSTTDLASFDVVTVGGIRATSPTRTLIDAAGVVPEPTAVEMIDEALARGLTRPERLERRARELWAPRRRGCAVVLRALASRHPELERARNLWERRILRLCRRYGLPEPVPNHPVLVDGRVRYLDLAWPAERVFVEFDGFLPHMGRETFDDDRARQNALVDLTWTPFRSTSANIQRDPDRAFAPIARAVKRRQADGIPAAG
jgi:hypothetical protein